MKVHLTISAEAEDIRLAREVAQRQGTTLNEMLRGYLHLSAGGSRKAEAIAELLDLFRNHAGSSDGSTIRRDDAYTGRT